MTLKVNLVATMTNGLRLLLIQGSVQNGHGETLVHLTRKGSLRHCLPRAVCLGLVHTLDSLCHSAGSEWLAGEGEPSACVTHAGNGLVQPVKRLVANTWTARQGCREDLPTLRSAQQIGSGVYQAVAMVG
ncbi:hypothetical protein V2G26_009826 [Clonostachys chloroleuca]